MPTRARLTDTGFDKALFIESFDVPTPSDGELLLRVEACGVCHRDLVGSPTFNSSLRCARMGGHIVVVGNVSTKRAQLNLGYAIVHGLHIHGSSGARADDMSAILALHADQPLDLALLRDRVVPLEQAEAAQRAIQSGGLAGRIVLDCGRAD